jgi:hypothetical protein
MPGFPAIKIADPLTNPPPNNLLISIIFVSTLSRLYSTSLKLLKSPNSPASALTLVNALLVIFVSKSSSIIVFQALHSEHLPCHFLKIAPQFWHMFIQKYE